MKKIVSIIIFVGLLFAACDTTSSDNDELDGLWYLTQVDTLSNNHSVDYRNKRIFWSFQGTLAQFNCADNIDYYMSYFTYTEGRLEFKDMFYYDRVNGDSIINSQTLDQMRPFGINSLNENFIIKSISNSNLILQDNELRLHFEKY